MQRVAPPRRRRARRAAWHASWLVGGALAATAGCKDVLKVQDPQTFATEDLNAPQILKAVADGVEGQFQQVFDDHVVFSGLLGDEVIDTSTWIEWADISLGRIRADWPTATPGWSTTQDELLRTRFSAISAQERFANVLAADAAKSPLTAQVRTTEAWADLILGMDYCEAPLVPGGARQPDTELIKQAVTKFGDAIAISTAAGAADFRSWATAGRARANLLAGNYAAALADAQAVPDGYVKQALYSTSSATSFPGNQLHINRNRSGGLHRLYWSRVDTTPALGAGNAKVTLYVKDPWSGQADRRMAVLHAPGQLGVNNSTPQYSIDKYSDYTAPITITSKREMNLIAAEVYWRQGDLARAVEQLNLNRTRAGVALPAFAMPLSANEVRDRIISERFAELFVEGHRLADLNRFGLVAQQLGAGRAMKMPLSRNEILNNTSLKLGDAKCPGLTS
jgi:hypothetical protein